MPLLQITDEEYRERQREIGAVGGSEFGGILTSLAHWLARKGRPANEAMIRGSAIHCAVLEPDDFAERYPVKRAVFKDAEAFEALKPSAPVKGEDGSWTVAGVDGSFSLRKEAKAATPAGPPGPWHVDGSDEWFRTREDANAEAGDGISESEAETIAETAHAVHLHPIAGPLFNDAECERVAFWEDEESGVQCCAKADAWDPDGRILVDLKTVNRTILPADAAKWILGSNYHVQMAHYSAGVEAATGSAPAEVWIVCVEALAPHAVACYRLSPEFLALGAWRRREALARLSAWDRSQPAPAFPAAVVDLDPPAWAIPAEFSEEALNEWRLDARIKRLEAAVTESAGALAVACARSVVAARAGDHGEALKIYNEGHVLHREALAAFAAVSA